MVRGHVLVMLAALALAGCAGSAMPVMPSFPNPTETGEPKSLSAGRGIAVIGAGISGLDCGETVLVIARRDESGFSRVTTVSIRSRFGKGAKAAAVELAPGEYHVAHVACRNGKFVRFVGPVAEPGIIPWHGKAFTQSLATFTVAEGEVAEFGTINIVRQKIAGFGATGPRAVTLTAAPLADAERERFNRDHAGLAPGLKPKPMQVAAASGMVLDGCTLISETGGAKRPALPTKIQTSGDLIEASRAVEVAPTACPANSDSGGGMESLLQ